jgi:spore maturation protein CgeB
MPLSYLIVDAYYPRFLDDFYAKHPEAVEAGYHEAHAALMAQCFGTADFYSKNLRALGNSAREVVANDPILQAKWAAEHGKSVGRSRLRAIADEVPYLRRFAGSGRWLDSLLLAQIKEERPDVLYLQDLTLCEPEFIGQVRPFVKIIVGQIASPLPADRLLRGCDVILTSFPHYRQRFRSQGIASEYFRTGFEASLLERLERARVTRGVVFVGGMTNLHIGGNALLEHAADRLELHVWGYGIDGLDADSPIRRHYQGEAWGLEMYRVLASSKITINRHGEVAENYANNMRLFEATGVGTLLMTDEKDNLGELFELGKEVVAYSDADDLVDKIGYYLAHDEERERIARAGQARTLREHTYLRRMRELEQILSDYL